MAAGVEQELKNSSASTQKDSLLLSRRPRIDSLNRGVHQKFSDFGVHKGRVISFILRSVVNPAVKLKFLAVGRRLQSSKLPGFHAGRYFLKHSARTPTQVFTSASQHENCRFSVLDGVMVVVLRQKRAFPFFVCKHLDR